VRTSLSKPPSFGPDYQKLYQEHHGRILRLCRILLSNPEEAEDVAQEVFVKALDYWGNNSMPESWPRWLTTVAINTCRDRRRSSWWKRWLKSTDDFDEREYPDEHAAVEHQVIRREQYERIWQRLRKLSRRQQEVFALRYIEGWSTQEVSEALGLTPGSVKRHLTRAIDNLRKGLA